MQQTAKQDESTYTRNGGNDEDGFVLAVGYFEKFPQLQRAKLSKEDGVSLFRKNNCFIGKCSIKTDS